MPNEKPRLALQASPFLMHPSFSLLFVARFESLLLALFLPLLAITLCNNSTPLDLANFTERRRKWRYLMQSIGEITVDLHMASGLAPGLLRTMRGLHLASGWLAAGLSALMSCTVLCACPVRPSCRSSSATSMAITS